MPPGYSAGRTRILPFRPSVDPPYVFARLVPVGQFTLGVQSSLFPLADATGANLAGSAWQGTVDTSSPDPIPVWRSPLDRLTITWPTKTVQFFVGN